jgi:hypothetical protein
MDKTGFHAYWIYETLKHIHFKKGDYDITKHRLPQKEKWAKAWNTKRRHHDGMIFLTIEEHVPYTKQCIVEAIAFYWVRSLNFYPKEILEDGFVKYQKYRDELNLLKSVVTTDFATVCVSALKKEQKIKDMFVTDSGLPPIVWKYLHEEISPHSLIAFELATDFRKHVNVESLNMIEKEKWEKIELIFDKYYQIVYNYYANTDWKEFLKTLYH